MGAKVKDSKIRTKHFRVDYSNREVGSYIEWFLEEAHSVQVAEIDGSIVSKVDILRTFLELNSSGVPQTEEHIARARKLLEAEISKGAK